MAKMRLRSVLLFGAPGVGKGTQGRILATIPGFFHLSSGDVFRSIDVGSPEGKEIVKYSSSGNLVPDELTIRIWKKALEGYIALSNYKPREDLLILDGIPRSVSQAELLEKDIEVLQVIHLVCPDEDRMVDRLRRRAIRENRADDANETVIRHRFDIYREISTPILEHYDQKLISTVNAVGSPASVLRSVLECVVPIQDEVFRGTWE